MKAAKSVKARYAVEYSHTLCRYIQMVYSIYWKIIWKNFIMWKKSCVDWVSSLCTQWELPPFKIATFLKAFLKARQMVKSK